MPLSSSRVDRRIPEALSTSGERNLTVEAPGLDVQSTRISVAGPDRGFEDRYCMAGPREPRPAVVTELMPLGSFATWQAERAIGDHDRATLRLRLDPQGDTAGLAPGMTVWLTP